VGKFKLFCEAKVLKCGLARITNAAGGCKAGWGINFLPIIFTKPTFKNTLSNCYE